MFGPFVEGLKSKLAKLPLESLHSFADELHTKKIIRGETVAKLKNDKLALDDVLSDVEAAIDEDEAEAYLDEVVAALDHHSRLKGTSDEVDKKRGESLYVNVLLLRM